MTNFLYRLSMAQKANFVLRTNRLFGYDPYNSIEALFRRGTDTMTPEEMDNLRTYTSTPTDGKKQTITIKLPKDWELQHA